MASVLSNMGPDSPGNDSTRHAWLRTQCKVQMATFGRWTFTPREPQHATT